MKRPPRRPTEKQLARLAVLSRVGTAVVGPTRREWGPLLQRGLVAPLHAGSHDERYLPPLEITPDGLRALADFRDEHGRWPGAAAGEDEQ